MPLPIPKGRQREVLALGHQGHFAILGTAGSGKTTLAILRAAYLSDLSVDHGGRTLLLTFNRALVTYLEHLGHEDLRNVQVETYHTFARGYLNSKGAMRRNAICGPDLRRQCIARAVFEIHAAYPAEPILARRVEFFENELQWIAGNGITQVNDYISVPRHGQRTPLLREARRLVWQVRDRYLELREEAGKDYDWDDVASTALRFLKKDSSPRLYRHIVIDEGQDLSPEMLRSLALAVPGDGSITFFGDVAQQIYGTHRASWRSAGLNVSKVVLFEENYRNTKQIAKLALAISGMPYYRGLPDLVEPREPKADGPRPTVVRFASAEAERDFVRRRATLLAQSESVAVLFSSRVAQQIVLPTSVTRAGVRLHRDMTAWPEGPGLRYGTYHSAKGLEFDTVILPLCSADDLPDPDFAEAHGEDDATSYYGRLLYVGVTRARLNLIITCTGDLTQLMPPQDDLYRIVDA